MLALDPDAARHQMLPPGSQFLRVGAKSHVAQPLGAMWRSLLLPGWGQALLHRRVTGAVFVFWEGLSLTMTLKAQDQLRFLRETNGDTLAVRLKKQEVQDWAVVLAFNHLMAAAEAFVSAELWDFPAELEARALPRGRVGIGAAFYVGR